MLTPLHRWMSHRVLRSLLMLVWVFGTSSLMQTALAQGVPASEGDVRAAMVSHLALFVEWPPTKSDSANPQFRVCLLGADPIAAVLETAFHNVSGVSAPIVFSRVNATDRLDTCHLLYIGVGARGSFARLMPALTSASVLTVSERSIDVAVGEVIGLPLEDNHVRIEVNLAAAQNSNLTVSSKLLRLAAVVKRP